MSEVYENAQRLLEAADAVVEQAYDRWKAAKTEEEASRKFLDESIAKRDELDRAFTMLCYARGLEGYNR